jgi:hypothetical protein
MKGAFYNSKQSVCSIWESGRMCYDALKLSDRYVLDYTEECAIDHSYDFMVYNHHITVNNWITEEHVKRFGKPTFCIVTEVGLQGSPIKKVPEYFNHYIVLDPTIKETPTIHAFGRPIEYFNLDLHPYISRAIPKIGSFGLATPGKSWHKIVESVQNEFDEAEIHFNIPHGSYTPYHGQLVDEIKRNCNQIIKKSGIKLTITHELWTKYDVLKFCSQNTLNFFYYEREQMYDAGLSAVTDQAIASGRPLLVTSDSTFRHIHKYLDCYPEISVKECIETSQNVVLQMKNDWSSYIFLTKFENILMYV